ncbi:hypothetical protein BC940DRAFT_268126 [Gongronella butleri]|nr:hypothetical protein BC940DRAFT_268126 [Gongronella butleri]
MTSSLSLPSPTISSKDQTQAQTTPVQVALRIRPLTQQDRLQPRFSNCTDTDVLKTINNTITVVPHQKSYTFDHVFDPDSSQEQVYNGVASNLVDRFLDGYNVTILAYGQTSSGKTYTMGTALDMEQDVRPDEEGIIPRAVSSLFERLQHTSTSSSSPSSSDKPNGHATFPPGSQQQPQQRIARRAYSSSKLRPVSMMNPSTSDSSSSHASVTRRGSAPLDALAQKTTRHTIHVSFVEIYNEELIDLLNPAPMHERPPATIREDTKGQIKWTGVKELPVESAEDVLRYLQMGTANRATGSTDMNAKSSRSHAIFSVMLKQEKWVPSASQGSKSTTSASKKRGGSAADVMLPVSSKSSLVNRRGSCLNVRAMIGQMERQQDDLHGDDGDGDWMVSFSKCHFVDLAGSERLKRTAAEGDRRKEGININAGLLALGNVISALAAEGGSGPAASKKAQHIPYRDSKLTRLLQDSLGGNATTLMIACVSPAEINLTETANTIKYAHRARHIKNKAERNEAEEWMTNDSPEFLRNMITRLKADLRKQKSSTSTTPNHHHQTTTTPRSSPGTPTLDYNDNGSIVMDDDTSQLHQLADYRRQIEELHNELTVTRERNRWVESQLRDMGDQEDNHNVDHDDSENVVVAGQLPLQQQQNKHHLSRVSNGSQDSALGGSLDFQHLVEPVIEEYEKSISGLESQLAMARAALTHSDDALMAQEKEMEAFKQRHAQEVDTLKKLHDQVAKLRDREQSAERYILELETKLAASSEQASHDKDTLSSLKNKIIQFQDKDATAEQYIDSLETRLAKANEDSDRWNVLVDAAEKRIALQEAHIASLEDKLAIDAKHTQDAAVSTDDADDLLQQLEASQSQRRELQETLASIKRHSVLSMSAMVADLQVANVSSASLHEEDDVDMDKEKRDLEAQLALKEAMVTTLQAKLDEMGSLHEQLADLRATHDEKVATLDAQLQQAKDAHAEAQETTKALEKQLASTQADHQEAMDKHAELQKQLFDHEKGTQITLRRRLENIEELKRDVAALQSVVIKQDQIIALGDLKLKEMHATVDKMQQQLKAKDETIDQLKDDNEAKASALQAVQQQVAQLLRELAHLGVQKSQLDLMIQWVDKSLANHDAKTTTTLATLADLKHHHTLRDTEYETTIQRVQELETRVSDQVATIDTLKKELADAQTALSAAHEKEIDIQRVAALESRVIELDKAVDAANKEKDDLMAKFIDADDARAKAVAAADRHQQKVAQLETQLQEAMQSMEKERELVSANDTTGLIAELEEKLQVLQRARQLDQDEFDVRFDRAMDDLEDARRAYKEQSHMVATLEQSLEHTQQRLDEAIASHAKKTAQQLQQFQELRRRPSSSTGPHPVTSSSSPPAAASTSNGSRRARSDSINSSVSLRQLADVEEETLLQQEQDEEIHGNRRVSMLMMMNNNQHHHHHQSPPLSPSTSTAGPRHGSLLMSAAAAAATAASVAAAVPALSSSSSSSSYDVASLLHQLEEQERLLKEKDEALFKLEQQHAESQRLSPATRERVALQQQELMMKDDLSREALVDTLKQTNKDNATLLQQVDALEAQLATQRTQFAAQTKQMEQEWMKLAAANDRMEKEMEQLVPRASMSTASSNHSISATSPPQSQQPQPQPIMTSPPHTPRVSSPTPSASSSMKMPRTNSINVNTLAKLQKSNSTSSRHHPSSNDDASRPPSVLRSPIMDRPSSTASASAAAAAYRSIPPPSAPPSNPLPPIPTTPLPQPPSPPASALQRNNSTNSDATHHTHHTTTNSSIPTSQQSTLTTADQYEKLLRSLQRKAQVAESDVRAHQEVISKLESQLSRSETSVRDVKKQLEVLHREKQAYSLEIQNLRSQVTQIMTQQKSSVDEQGERRKQLEHSLEQERKLKEKAEKARMILENRMEELMNKKNKFMCF